MQIFLTTLIPVLFLIFFKYGNKFGNKLNLIDKKKVPLLGGIFLYIGFIINLFYKNNYSEDNLYLIDLYFLSSIFIISLLDDIYNLKPHTRLLLIIFIVIFFVDKNNLFINTINSQIFGFYYFSEINLIKFIFPTFCIIVLINAYNFTDGINGLASLIGLSWFSYLFINYTFLFDLYKIFYIFIFFFLILNFLNKSFLGDSGNYIISSIIGFIIITINQKLPYSIFVEEILLLFLLPGIDLIRLFFKRIINKKSPLSGDLDHFHHILMKKLNLNKTLFIYLILLNFPLYIYFLFQINLVFLLLFQLAVYFLLLKKFSLRD